MLRAALRPAIRSSVNLRGLAAAAGGALRKTPLYDSHVALGGKMVEFGGWDMPVQYPAGIVKSHEHTRVAAGLFDVSHMLGCVVRGADRVAFMESLCTADLAALPDGMGSLTVITNEAGGVIDDCIVTNAGDHLYMVINAGHEEIDLPHIKKHMDAFVKSGKDVSFETLADNGILALQGPKAAAVLQKLVTEDLNQMGFMYAKPMSVAGIDNCFVARSGYTGEDGFEIAVPKGSGGKHGVVTLWEKLLEDSDVMPVGLGARDSLRLEAGLCLYGNDLDTTTSPAEGTLFWVVHKTRRKPGSFVGSERILEEIKNKCVTRHAMCFLLRFSLAHLCACACVLLKQVGDAQACGLCDQRRARAPGHRHHQRRRRGGRRRHLRRPLSDSQEGYRYVLCQARVQQGGHGAVCDAEKEAADDHDHEDAVRAAKLLQRAVRREM